MATRVTLTAVPCRVNSQTGPVAGPRLVSIDPLASVAAVICIIVQSLQGAVAVSRIAATACCAESTGTVAAVPSGQRTSPSGGCSPGRPSGASTMPA